MVVDQDASACMAYLQRLRMMVVNDRMEAVWAAIEGETDEDPQELTRKAKEDADAWAEWIVTVGICSARLTAKECDGRGLR